MSLAETEPIVYEDSDGEPMSENTLQFRWIVTLQGGLDAAFRADPNVFVAGDLLWYPVEGQPRVRVAPDAMVVLGRPKGYRGSYKQWEEGGVAPQVVFEVLSPGNRPAEMAAKRAFYEAHGVEEYYIYDPDNVTLAGHLRDTAGQFDEVPVMDGHVSPRLGIRFELADELVVHAPNGGSFLTYLELVEQNEAQQIEAQRERQDAVRAYAEVVQRSEAQQIEAQRERRDAERAYAEQVERSEAQRVEAQREREAAERAYAEVVERIETTKLENARIKQAAEWEREAAVREREKVECEREAAEHKRYEATAALEALRARLRAAGIDPDGV